MQLSREGNWHHKFRRGNKGNMIERTGKPEKRAWWRIKQHSR